MIVSLTDLRMLFGMTVTLHDICLFHQFPVCLGLGM